MKTIMKNLIGALLVAAALGTAQPQSTSHDLRLSDLKAKQPQEAIFDSALCQRAREAPTPHHVIYQLPPIDPKTFLPDLNSLMAKSDDVVLAIVRDHAELVSPSGENPVTYTEVRVIRSWKGSHRGGDILTYGWPGGRTLCDHASVFVYPGQEPGAKGYSHLWDQAFVLFLRQSKDQEGQLVEGLRPTAGAGAQGSFPIQILDKTNMTDVCYDTLDATKTVWDTKKLSSCDSYLETTQNPMVVPYDHDPLRNKYNGMPASDFLWAVQSVAASQGLADKSSLR